MNMIIWGGGGGGLDTHIIYSGTFQSIFVLKIVSSKVQFGK